MKLEGFGIFTRDIAGMAEFYRSVLGFEIEYQSGDKNVYLKKDGVLFLMYGREDCEQMLGQKLSYPSGKNGTFEIALAAENFAAVDREYEAAVQKGAQPILPPSTMPWGQRTCYIADIEDNLIEIGSFVKE